MRRRPFQFGLGALLLVVTAIGIVLGYVKHVSEVVKVRRAILDGVATEHGCWYFRSDATEPQALRKYYGDVPEELTIFVPDAMQDQMPRICSYFPQARVKKVEIEARKWMTEDSVERRRRISEGYIDYYPVAGKPPDDRPQEPNYYDDPPGSSAPR